MSANGLRGRPRRSPLTRVEQLAASQRAFRERRRSKGLERIEITLPCKLVAAINQAVKESRVVTTRSDVLIPPLAEFFLRPRRQSRKK